MNSLLSETQTPSEQFGLALEGDNIFDMQTSMERWFQGYYRDDSIRVFWEEQIDHEDTEKRRLQDQVIESEDDQSSLEYEGFTLYGHRYTLLIYTEKDEVEEKIENDFERYRPHIVKRIHDISIADTDALTGLCSAKIFFQKSKELDENPDSRYAIIYFDIDNLKGINNKYGHIGGDAYIKAFAEVLKKTFRSYDYIVRKGGDEFVVIITNEREYTESILTQKIEAVQREFAKQEIILSDTLKIIKNSDTPPSASGGYGIKTIDMKVSFGKMLDVANHKANQEKTADGILARLQEMIATTDDFRTLIEVAKYLGEQGVSVVGEGIQKKVLEIIGKDNHKKIRRITMRAKRKVNRLMQVIRHY